MKREEPRVTLEQYLHFYENPWRFDLKRLHLNRIIEMHGFVKLYHQPKILLMQCLDSIELMPPTRSTLEQSISSCAFLTADEVADDLEALGWQECSVRSIRSLRSEAEQAYIASNTDLPFVPAGSTSASHPRGRPRRRSRAPAAVFIVTGRRPRSKRKRVSINALTAATSSTPAADDLRSAPVPPPPAYSPPPTPPPPAYSPPPTPAPPSSPPPPTPPPPASPPPSYSFFWSNSG